MTARTCCRSSEGISPGTIRKPSFRKESSSGGLNVSRWVGVFESCESAVIQLPVLPRRWARARAGTSSGSASAGRSRRPNGEFSRAGEFEQVQGAQISTIATSPAFSEISARSNCFANQSTAIMRPEQRVVHHSQSVCLIRRQLTGLRSPVLASRSNSVS